ncbi:hypothetical protein ARALYDRAFT_346994 [Arabidopsis lyrata subsp. lyrata]|uniref:Cytochrome P450 n=1 Tax=Arabidopsis lyrata subsp. lyrata TaxID=81972 RepID=D7LR40_ARALL|nr:hypothetical protein ARALYDRAFT_346994 [Arabidopsis lyrata subsp. lyrata]
MAPIWFLSLLFLSCILLAAFTHKKRRKNQQPPSPPGFPIIGNLHQLGELPHQSLWSLSKTYGPVMLLRLGSVPTVVVSSSETAKQALKIHDLHCCSRPSLAELFSVKRVHSIQPIKEEEVKKLIDSATESASQKSPVNLSEKSLDLTASVICKAAFGLSFHSTVLNNDGFDKLIREAFLFLGSFSASNFQMVAGSSTGSRGVEDFVDLLLRLEKEETVPGYGKLTRNHIKAILMNVLLGAINTSAMTMTWAMAELIRNLRVMKKVQSEIRNQMRNQSVITLDDIDHLPYLNMRSCLNLRSMAIGRDPESWKDADTFFPERFMENNIDAKGQNFELLPFGSGRRICPGMYMGTTMVEFGLANMLYQFDWELPEGMVVEDIDMEESPGLAVGKKNELLLVPVKYLGH